MADSRTERPVALSRHIAWRQVSSSRGGGPVSFMSGIAISGLALGVALLLTVLSIMNGFDRELRGNVLGVVPHLVLRSPAPASEGQWSALAVQLEGSAGIASLSRVIEMQAVVATSSGHAGIMVHGVDALPEAEASVLDAFMGSGGLGMLDETRWGIVLGEALAQRLQVSLGDSVDVYSPQLTVNPVASRATFRRFEVSGIFRIGSQQLDDRLALVNRDAARALFRLRSGQNALWLRADDALDADRLLAELAAGLPAGVSIDSWTREFGAIYENIRFSRALISFLLWLLIAVAAFNLVVSLIMIVRDRRADIAVLRALGASPATIGSIFVWQGALIALAGLGIGLLLGVLGSLHVSDLANFIEARFGVELLNAEVYPIDYLPSQLRFADIATISLGVLSLALLATLYPASRAARVLPAVALRSA